LELRRPWTGFAQSVNRMSPKRTVVFGVTAGQSVQLLGSIPGRMANSGWKVHIVSGEKSGVTSGIISHHCVPMARRPSPVQDVLAFYRWVKLLNKLEPDVVSIGTPKAALLGLIAAKVCDVPTRVYVLRGLRLEGSKGFFRGILSLFERITASCATEILSVSQSLRDLYVDLGLSPSSKIETLGKGSSHGVDLHYFKSIDVVQRLESNVAQQSRTGGTPVLLFVGRFSEDKGASLLLECKRILDRRGVGHELVIVGDIEGSESVFRELLESQTGVQYAGSQEDVRPYYRGADILLLPTKREGLPNVVLEAAAMGVPTVTTDCTGAKDSVIHGVTGLIVPAGDSSAFADAVIRLIRDPVLREKTGFGAQRWVKENFDSRKISEIHAEYYANLAMSRQRYGRSS
jgi:glycosyltransferase involved in cell wall biosynthesis